MWPHPPFQEHFPGLPEICLANPRTSRPITPDRARKKKHAQHRAGPMGQSIRRSRVKKARSFSAGGSAVRGVRAENWHRYHCDITVTFRCSRWTTGFEASRLSQESKRWPDYHPRDLSLQTCSRSRSWSKWYRCRRLGPRCSFLRNPPRDPKHACCSQGPSNCSDFPANL